MVGGYSDRSNYTDVLFKHFREVSEAPKTPSLTDQRQQLNVPPAVEIFTAASEYEQLARLFVNFANPWWCRYQSMGNRGHYELAY